MPPDQLLRLVFETCETFSAARRALENIAVARPVIFVLVGCGPGERCVIERTEGDFRTRESETSAANDWVPSRPMWEARIAADRYLVCSSTEATDRCSARRDALACWDGLLSQSGFDWLKPPVLNRYTRLAITMNPSSAILRVAGSDVAFRSSHAGNQSIRFIGACRSKRFAIEQLGMLGVASSIGTAERLPQSPLAFNRLMSLILPSPLTAI